MQPSEQFRNAKERRDQEAIDNQRVEDMRMKLSITDKQKEKKAALNHHQEKLKKLNILENELLNVKSNFKKIDIEKIPRTNANERIKAEVNNLEIREIELNAQKGRLEDKIANFKEMYEEANKIIENAHVEALDKEEIDYMAIQIENKKNDLLSSRNYVKEMQIIGWSQLPPKVADECRKTQIELDYVYQTTKTIKDETAEALILLQVTEEDLITAQVEYNKIKKYNKQLEDDIDLVVEEINRISSTVNVKEVEAKDLQEAAFYMKAKIEEAIVAQEKAFKENELNREQIERERNELREKMKLRNKEVDELKEEYASLTQEAKEAEEKVSNMQKILREQKALFKNKVKKAVTAETLTAEINEVRKECKNIIEETVKETKLKHTYFNVIEDMLGNLKILCSCRNTKTSNVTIKDNTNINFKSSKESRYKFDYIFDVKAKTEDILDKIEHFYNQLNEGYNCYVVALGERNSGKTYNILGENEDGLLFLGLEKIKEIIKINTKSQLTTRMFACAVEIGDTKMYDLLQNKLSNTFEIKKDYFGMTVIKNAQYTECSTEDQVKTCFIRAIQNRKAAFGALNSTDTNFVSIMTIQVYNKFQHRYNKGKMTYIKFGSISKNKYLVEELEKMATGKAMNYNKCVITQLLRDCFGGNAKTCVLGCIDPSESAAYDSMTTLKLVSSLKAITNEIGRNIESEEIFKLKNNIERLLRGAKQEYL